MTNATTSPTSSHSVLHPDPAKVRRALDKRAFCTLATTSPAAR